MARRLLVSPGPHTDVVRRLTDLHAQVEQAGRVALEKARQAGQLLLALPGPTRAAVAREAGLSDRTRQVYMQIAENWSVIEVRIAQRAAPPASIRAALTLIKGSSTRTKIETYTLRLDSVSSPETLAKALSSVRGRSVTITVRVRQDAVHVDPRQVGLPFEDE